MRFILRREECNIDNFLLWQSKSGKVVECKELWLSAALTGSWLLWFVVLYNCGITVATLVPGVPLIALIVLFEVRCQALAVKRPFR